MFFPDASREKMSSHEPVPLEVSRSTHFTSTPVKALAVTRTLRGITTQRVLIGTVSDQVHSIQHPDCQICCLASPLEFKPMMTFLHRSTTSNALNVPMW